MDELKKLVVERLVKETDPNKQIQILQEINKTILTKYVIQIGNFTIEPLWVEAYYYDQNKFPDCNTHMSDKQKNRFGQLYFHEKGRGGLDICLSAPVPDHEDYYLSVLLKATLLYETGKRITDGKAFKKQTEIYDILTETGLTEQDIEKMDSVLVKSALKIRSLPLVPYMLFSTATIFLSRADIKSNGNVRYALCQK